jgi:eukaryotic-like serine/threonine-protein kinase
MSSSTEVERIGHQVLGRYRVMRRLAHGGMGIVYLGRLEGAAGFAKPVVIKRIISDPEDHEGSTARFIREAQILSNLQHPGIVGVLDFGEEDERYAMVLEYVSGYDLGRWLKYLQLNSQMMHWEEAVFIILKVLEALAYAHGFRRGDGSSAEVLHRDISPGNILLDVEGRVRLVDFGIARMEANTGELYKTETGVLKGKLAFLAPELFAGMAPSRASDLYACAVILYQMLAGANPFTADNDNRIMWRVIMEGPKPLARERDDLPPGLEASLFMALNRDPGRRQASVERFAEELRQTLFRSESEIGAALRERVRADFSGDMPALLRLETLAERDRAWRRDLLTQPALDLAFGWAEEPAVVLPSPTPPTLSHERAPRAAVAEALTVRQSGPARPKPTRPGAPSSPASRRSIRSLAWKPLLGIGLGMSVVTGLIMAGALFLLRQPAPVPSSARFIVVQGGDEVAPASPPAATPAALPALEPVVHDAAAARAAPSAAVPVVSDPGVRKPATSPAHPGKKSTSAALSRALSRREPELSACFESYAAEVRGQPEVAIEFEVDGRGKVVHAALVPRSLESSPLGRCLLGVARTTQFGPNDKVTRFTIPIHASSTR